jgi:hypothetical protein
VTGTPVVRSRRAELSSAPAGKPRVSPPCPCLPGFSADQLGAERTRKPQRHRENRNCIITLLCISCHNVVIYDSFVSPELSQSRPSQ